MIKSPLLPWCREMGLGQFRQVRSGDHSQRGREAGGRDGRSIGERYTRSKCKAQSRLEKLTNGRRRAHVEPPEVCSCTCGASPRPEERGPCEFADCDESSSKVPPGSK
jgi:hypothetical protein